MSRLTDTGTPPANAIIGFDVRAHKDKTHDANLIELVTKDFPPILLVHSTNDDIVSYQQSVEMKNKVEKLTGRVSELITFEGAGHGDPKIKSTENVINNLHFMDELLKT